AVFRVKANGHRVEILAEIERDPLKRAQLTVEYLRADERAVEVDEREHNRSLAKIIAKAHGSAGFVAKGQIEWNLLVHSLRDANSLQRNGLRRCRLLRRKRQGHESHCNHHEEFGDESSLQVVTSAPRFHRPACPV